MWLRIIQQKYLRGQPLTFCQRSGGSQFWRSIIQLLHVLRIGTSIEIGFGTATLFWFYSGLATRPLRPAFPDIFSIAVAPQISVAAALIDLEQLALRRPFGPAENPDWQELLDCIAVHEPDLTIDDDRARWRLEPSG